MAQAMPPSAFKNTKVGHGMWLMPASQAAAMRGPATQRPRKMAWGRGAERTARPW
jgi:hypothetical protein